MTGLLIPVAMLLLMLLLAAPGWFAISRARGAAAAGIFYLALFAGLGLYNVGLPSGGSALDMPSLGRDGAAGAAPAGYCARTIRQLEQAGLILDRSNAERVTVSQPLWAQLPQQAKDGVITCLEGAGPPGTRRRAVEIVEIAR